MKMDINILAKYIVNTLELKDNELLNVLLKEYEKVFSQEKRAWWGNDTYKHVITTIMARVNSPYFTKKSLSLMATNIPLLIGIYLSINPRVDNHLISVWNKFKDEYNQLKDNDEKKKLITKFRNSIKDSIRENEKVFFEKSKDMNTNLNVSMLNSFNEVFYTYYNFENDYNTIFSYENVKEVIAFFTNYYNLVHYFSQNNDTKNTYLYPFICPHLDKEKKTIILFETYDLDKLRENLNEFIKYCRSYYYPLLISKNEEK